ncbi:ricin-type beta-trefoil lectin domain protein [Streptomyces sp. NPDC059757]|uniref:RICIN domain-containing protein n=1 Tax=Streptomyces sp. NPDC059757 TaxID=3346935 RepID=UPI003662CD44
MASLPAAAPGNRRASRTRQHCQLRWAGPAAASALVSQASGKCLDNFNGSTTKGNPVGIWTCNTGANQQWASGSGGQLTADGRCLDAAGHGTTSGTDVTTWSCNGGTNQQWALQSDGTLRGTQSGLCLGVVGASKDDGANVAPRTRGRSRTSRPVRERKPAPGRAPCALRRV